MNIHPPPIKALVMALVALYLTKLSFTAILSEHFYACLKWLISEKNTKFFVFCRTTGLYTTTLVNIIQKDITRFMVFFSVIFVGFCGAMYMALKVNDMQDTYRLIKYLMYF